jgi:hypothetical protein
VDTDFETIGACKDACSHRPVAGQVSNRGVTDGPQGRGYRRRHLEISPVQQQIKPIQRQDRDDRDPNKCLRRLRAKTDPQTRPARCERRKRVEVKRREAAERHEHEWIPFQCSQQVTVKELNPAPRHPTGDAWQTGDLMKRAARPRQTNC